MLKDLTKRDWLGILGISAEIVPSVLILRGTRNLKRNHALYSKRFQRVHEVGSPNGLVEDVFIGEWNGASVGYASVYGPAMASEVTHLFGVLGTRIVLQTGCCGLWKDGADAGDLFVPSHAFCGEGAAQYYAPDPRVVHATLEVGDIGALPVDVHSGRIYTTAALFAEGTVEIERWASDGWDGVDMETATTFTVAEHFGMKAAAILFAFDNPRDHGDIVLNESQKDERRRAGNEAMIEATFKLVERLLSGR